jgi:phage/plasmid-associated DNA primase
MRGLLRWAVDGAKDWYSSDEGLKSPELVKRAGEVQREEQDFIQQFLDECTDESKDGFTSFPDLYQSYVGWCSGLLTAQKSKSFSLTIQGKKYKSERRYVIDEPTPPAASKAQIGLFNGNGNGVHEPPEVRKRQVRGFVGLVLNTEGIAFLNQKKAPTNSFFAQTVQERE